ncbi:MAG: HlyC/CorC family transporter [Halobacteriovoraceae bacterium]|jgi:putative hemolysin|nr:HlyC/CorC family transporter [Halobacteriovoraceae bacterium]MBT5092639.1 HlyC/CorC family transporter [Halobacteriovoraceae bacterium]
MPHVHSYELLSLIGCFLASGFYSGSEAVLMSIGMDRARQLINLGGPKGKAMQFMVERPNELLTTILVGNNVVNILAAALVTTISARYFKSDSIGIATGITTMIILIFGEIIPKTFARKKAETLSYPVLQILKFNYWLLYPAIKAMVWMIKSVLGENAELHGRLITENDIGYMISRAEKEKTIDSKQVELLNSVLEFPKIKVKDIMIPRREVKSLDCSSSFKEIVDLVSNEVHSRYPVVDGELEKVVGFLHVKDLAFVDEANKENFDVNKLLKEPFFVFEHMRIQAVFDHMNRKKIHLALVKDENGVIVGIVTLEDIVEEVFGEIQDEHDEDEAEILEEYRQEDFEDGLLIEGNILLRDLDTDYDIEIPLNDNYSTLTGFLLDMLGNNFPEGGQIIVWEGLSFELEKVDDYEIRQVRIKHVDGDKHYFNRKKAQDTQGLSKNKTESKVSEVKS